MLIMNNIRIIITNFFLLLYSNHFRFISVGVGAVRWVAMCRQAKVSQLHAHFTNWTTLKKKKTEQFIWRKRKGESRSSATPHTPHQQQSRRPHSPWAHRSHLNDEVLLKKNPYIYECDKVTWAMILHTDIAVLFNWLVGFYLKFCLVEMCRAAVSV